MDLLAVTLLLVVDLLLVVALGTHQSRHQDRFVHKGFQAYACESLGLALVCLTLIIEDSSELLAIAIAVLQVSRGYLLWEAVGALADATGRTSRGTAIAWYAVGMLVLVVVLRHSAASAVILTTHIVLLHTAACARLLRARLLRTLGGSLFFGLLSIATLLAALWGASFVVLGETDTTDNLFYLGSILLSFTGLAVAMIALERSDVALERVRTVGSQAEHDLEESRRLLRTIVDSIPAVISVTDEASRVVFLNKHRAEITGIPAEEQIGKTWADLLDSEWGSRLTAGDQAVFASGKTVPFQEIELPRRDGATFVWLYTKIPLLGDDGEPRNVLTIGFDISERKQAEEKQQALEKQFHESQKLESLGVLAGGIAHDFNNLLVGVLGNADLALSALGTDDVRTRLQDIKIAATRAADLCRQMLAYAGRGRLRTKKIDLNELIREMSGLVNASLPKSVTLEYQLATDLQLVEGDETQIRQVAMNLLVNAGEAIGEAQGVVSITTGSSKGATLTTPASEGALHLGNTAAVFLQIGDTGDGMDEATKAMIFDPFFTTKFTGRGLGLAAVQGIIRSHGGSITVSSQPGVGSTFRVTLPAVEGDAELVQASAQESIHENLGKGLVLLVDDEEVVRAVGRKMLDRLGFEVLLGVDGQHAIDLVSESNRPITSIILDLTMPTMGGEEALRLLKQSGCPIPIILASGYTEGELSNRFQDSDIAGFLQKPFSLEQLSNVLERATFETPNPT